MKSTLSSYTSRNMNAMKTELNMHKKNQSTTIRCLQSENIIRNKGRKTKLVGPKSAFSPNSRIGSRSQLRKALTYNHPPPLAPHARFGSYEVSHQLHVMPFASKNMVFPSCSYLLVLLIHKCKVKHLTSCDNTEYPMYHTLVS